MPEMTLDAAKAVVDKAVEFEAWTWDDPSAVNDELIASTAKMLLDATMQAAQNDSVAPAVLEILKVSGATEAEPFNMSNTTREAYEQRFGKIATNGHAPPVSAEDASAMAKASAAPTTEPQAAPEPEPTAAEDISDIFPGYDDYKAADIKKAVLDSAAAGDLTEEEWARIKAYEEANEDRKTIRTLEPEFKAPEPEPTPEPVADAADATWSATPGAANTMLQSAEASDGVSAFYERTEPTRAQQERLPIPAQVDTSLNPPILPIDITTVSDQELSRTATQFHSCFAFAQWLQSQEEGRERAAEHLENEAHHDAYVAALAQHESAIPDDKRTAAAVENARRAAGHDADGATAVRSYRSRKVRHGIDARELKALAAGYDKAVWRINEELGRRARLATTRPS
jgi:hypothetical protein